MCADVGGRVEVTAGIPDPMFAGEMMGRTVAVWPEAGEVFAPISGTLTAAMPHAFGIAGDDGVEALVHVGVGSRGLPFAPVLSQRKRRREGGCIKSPHD